MFHFEITLLHKNIVNHMYDIYELYYTNEVTLGVAR